MIQNPRPCPECGAPIPMETWTECSPECQLRKIRRQRDEAQNKLAQIAAIHKDWLTRLPPATLDPYARARWALHAADLALMSIGEILEDS